MGKFSNIHLTISLHRFAFSAGARSKNTICPQQSVTCHISANQMIPTIASYSQTSNHKLCGAANTFRKLFASSLVKSLNKVLYLCNMLHRASIFPGLSSMSLICHLSTLITTLLLVSATTGAVVIQSCMPHSGVLVNFEMLFGNLSATFFTKLSNFFGLRSITSRNRTISCTATSGRSKKFDNLVKNVADR